MEITYCIIVFIVHIICMIVTRYMYVVYVHTYRDSSLFR